MTDPSAPAPEPLEPTIPATIRRVTLRDVAGHAGVSIAAASKVLRGAYGVSESMRERVEEAIATLGYRPNAAARGMRGKTFTVGVLMSNLENQFYGQVLAGLVPRFAEAGYEVLVGPAGTTAASQSAMVEAMIDHQLDGLILVATILPQEELERFAAALPLVLVAREAATTRYDTVTADDERASVLIVEHLVSLGHRRIAHITEGSSDPDPTLHFRLRQRGYESAMRRHGLEREIDVIATSWSDEGGAAAAAMLLERSELPTAVHAGADVAAFALLSAFWDHGIAVPGRVSVVGYDNSPTGRLAPISLTSIDQGSADLGRHGAELLLERIAGRTEPVVRRLEPTLVVRKTTGAPPA